MDKEILKCKFAAQLKEPNSVLRRVMLQNYFFEKVNPGISKYLPSRMFYSKECNVLIEVKTIDQNYLEPQFEVKFIEPTTSVTGMYYGLTFIDNKDELCLEYFEETVNMDGRYIEFGLHHYNIRTDQGEFYKSNHCIEYYYKYDILDDLFVQTEPSNLTISESVSKMRELSSNRYGNYCFIWNQVRKQQIKDLENNLKQFKAPAAKISRITLCFVLGVTLSPGLTDMARIILNLEKKRKENQGG